jgi:hypothetical protein
MILMVDLTIAENENVPESSTGRWLRRKEKYDGGQKMTTIIATATESGGPR